MREWNSILLSGYAKLPSNITAEAVYNVLAVTILFDKRTGVIISAEASMVTELAKHFISKLLEGYDLNDGPEDLMQTFETYYHGNAKKALETALRMVFVKYQEYAASQNETPND